MKVLVVCFLLFALVAADNTLKPIYVQPSIPDGPRKPPSSVDRITGGKTATLGQFPYQAGLNITTATGNGFCGGTLISNRTVLTAAHCCDVAVEIQVILGSVLIPQTNESSGVSITVPQENLKIHWLWNRRTLANDICIVTLPTAVTFNATIQPAKLPTNDLKIYYRRPVTTSGWGMDSDTATTISPVLRYVDSKIISPLTCGLFYFGAIRDTNICMAGAGGKSTCNGDSGGPLVLESDKTLIGITSFGIQFGCEIGWPAVFTRVSRYLPWIRENMS